MLLIAFQSAALIGDFNNWNPNADVMTRVCYLLLVFKVHTCELQYTFFFINKPLYVNKKLNILWFQLPILSSV